MVGDFNTPKEHKPPLRFALLAFGGLRPELHFLEPLSTFTRFQKLFSFPGRALISSELSMEDIRSMPKLEVANTLECLVNSRSLLKEKASGNPWTIGGVGNAI